VGTDHRPALPSRDVLPVSFVAQDEALRTILGKARSRPIDGVLGVDESSATLASRCAAALGLPSNPVPAVETLHDKLAFRGWQARAGQPHPRFRSLPLHASGRSAARVATSLGFPLVLKPRALSGSRGVVRVDSAGELDGALARVARVVSEGSAHNASCVAERYLPGREVALEVIVSNGHLHTLALFDKPETGAGPFFPETVYLAPSKLGWTLTRACLRAARALANGLGIVRGALHIELRVNAAGAFVIDAAARPIGGHCANVIRMIDGSRYESVLVRQALGLPLGTLRRERRAIGIAMLPVQAAGRVAAIEGLEEARAIPGVSDVLMTVAVGSTVAPLPEGDPYIGFVFAGARSRSEVEPALREARSALRVIIRPG